MPRNNPPSDAPPANRAGELQRKLDSLPKNPGVYQFKDAEGTIIYVGKAVNLRNRVRSYFQEKGAPDPKREVLVSKIRDLEIVVTDSEMEALLLENNLIKEHAPRYNVRLKDDKSYPYIVITSEPYPRVFPTRQVRRDGSRYFGPYTDVKAMHAMMRAIRSIFPIRSCDYHIDEAVIEKKKLKVCLDYHIQKCEGPCEGLVSHADYTAMIRQVEQLLKGKTRGLRGVLEEEMERRSAELAFEKAAEIRNRLMALQKYQDRQKVVSEDLCDRDILAVAAQENDAVGVLFRVRDGKIIGKQHFVLTGAEFETPGEIGGHLLQRYYAGTEDIPPEIFLQAEIEEMDVIAAWLSEKAHQKVELVVPKIGDKAKLVRMCGANAKFLLDEILMQKAKTDEFIPRSVLALHRDLRLPSLPRRIECFDISHFQGSETVASMVSFLDGKPRKSEYRKYRIRTVEGIDDFLSMKEVIGRRYRRLLDEQAPLPDLIIVDGGKGQLSSAAGVLAELGLPSQPVIGLAKRLEEVFLPGESDPQNIPKTSSGLKLLQRVRDEAHRFAITYHRSLRDKRTLRTELEEIEGIGPKRAQELLDKLGSVRAVRNASTEEIAAIIGWNAAQKAREFFELYDAEESAAPAEEAEESAGGRSAAGMEPNDRIDHPENQDRP